MFLYKAVLLSEASILVIHLAKKHMWNPLKIVIGFKIGETKIHIL